MNDAVANVSEAFNMGSLEEGATAALSSLSVETLAVKGAGRFVAAVGNFFSEVFLVLLFLVFLLPSHDVIMERVGRGLSRERRRAFFRTLEQIESSVRAYLVTKVLVSVGTALSSFVVMLLFGTKFALVFSVLVFVLNFIPNFGSFIAVATILVFEVVRLGFGWKVVFLAGLLILVQVVWGNILEPKFAARSLELSPIVVLLSLFFWGVVWGVWGLLFAVPLTASIKIILQNIPSTKKIALFLS
ncbi:AI-2E family transporter [Candidatus Woesearchaeota archaeon]|nr:MAG: AI-2E family transporter [Candidatus Woesearchaeota archaeon]